MQAIEAGYPKNQRLQTKGDGMRVLMLKRLRCDDRQDRERRPGLVYSVPTDAICAPTKSATQT